MTNAGPKKSKRKCKSGSERFPVRRCLPVLCKRTGKRRTARGKCPKMPKSSAK